MLLHYIQASLYRKQGTWFKCKLVTAMLEIQPNLGKYPVSWK